MLQTRPTKCSVQHLIQTSARKGNQPLESWLLQLLDPKVRFRFDTVDIANHRVVILEIERAVIRPVRFNGTEYVRIGEVKRPLREAPDREQELWRIFDQKPFKGLIAAERTYRTGRVHSLLSVLALFDGCLNAYTRLTDLLT